MRRILRDRPGGRPDRARAGVSVSRLLRAEGAGGALLLAAAVAALIWANSGGGDAYQRLWSTVFAFGAGPLAVSEDLRHMVNEGLMAVFFFVVGLEIKRELVAGELRDRRVAFLPVIAAAGGVVIPASLFLAVALSVGASGWGIPIATDIAFVVGVLAVLRSRVPAGARLFLVSLAVVDDVIAIVVIALYYTRSVATPWLAGAVATLALVVLLRRLGVHQIWPYVIVGVVAWYATFQSGVHATIAGVALGLLTPARHYRGRDILGVLQRRLNPLTAFAVIPLFGLANAGLDLRGASLADVSASRISWGVALGLLAGKTLGIALVTLACVRLRLGTLPAGTTARQVWGVAALAGIGFTMSLFIADLAYPDPTLVDHAKIGIFAGSLVSGSLGAALLMRPTRRRCGGRSRSVEVPTGRAERLRDRSAGRSRRRPRSAGGAAAGRPRRRRTTRRWPH